jgi:hypothetical protein
LCSTTPFHGAEFLINSTRLGPPHPFLDQIVEPTFADFEANPGSIRHAYLACVATYHAIDRAGEGVSGRVGNLKKKWREQSLEFVIVDMMAPS